MLYIRFIEEKKNSTWFEFILPCWVVEPNANILSVVTNYFVIFNYKDSRSEEEEKIKQWFGASIFTAGKRKPVVVSIFLKYINNPWRKLKRNQCLQGFLFCVPNLVGIFIDYLVNLENLFRPIQCIISTWAGGNRAELTPWVRGC